MKLSFPAKWKTKAESEAAQFGRDARTDWQLLCFIFLFLNLISVVLGVVVYERIDKGELFLTDKRETVELGTLDRFALEKAVNFIEFKREKFQALQSGTLRTSDPFVPKSKSK